MVSLEAFSELLEVLYSAPLDQEQWQRFLTLVSEHTESQLGLFFCAGSRSGLSVSAQGGSSRFDDLVYNEKYACTDPFRAPVFRSPLPGIVQGEDLLPNEGLLQTDLYRHILAPIRARYCTLVLLTLTVRRIESMTILRTIDQGPMNEDGVRLLELLFPHIQKALEIRQLFGVARQQAAGAQAMADASATATFLLSRQGRVLHCNSAADTLLQSADALSVREGILIATESSAKGSLRKLFSDAAMPVPGTWGSKPAHALALPRASGGQPLQLLASPLPPGYRSGSEADLVLLVADPERSVNFPDDVLRALYKLTPAQTEVANGLLTGYTLHEIAGLRGVSVGTVRQQVKVILGKTGASRQSDLVRLLMTLPQAARAD